MLVFDHLTRFTPETLDMLYRRLGLTLERRDARSDRIWLWDMVNTAGSPPAATIDVAAARARVDAHVFFVKESLAAFERMLSHAKPDETLALYGQGVLGLWARNNAGAHAGAIRYLLDDNAQIWGSRKAGLEIRGSKSIPELGVTGVFIAANPCYHDRMRANLVAVGIDRDRIYA